MSYHDEEVLGKAYDARLMRRLLTYVRPYRRQVVFAIAAIIAGSVLQLAPPYLTKIFGDVFTLVGIMIVLIVMDWRLALVAFSVLPLIALVAQWFRRNVRDSYRTVRTWIARINAYLQERITGMATVQLFRREEKDFETFDDIDRKHRDANIQSIFYYAVFYPAVELVGALAASLIIWFGGGWVQSGTLTLGSLVAFLLYSQRFFRPISDMSEKFNVLQAAMASSERTL